MKQTLLILMLILVLLTSCTKYGHLEVYNKTGGKLNIYVGESFYQDFLPDGKIKKTYEIKKSPFEAAFVEVEIKGSGENKKYFEDFAIVIEDETTIYNVKADK